MVWAALSEFLEFPDALIYGMADLTNLVARPFVDVFASVMNLVLPGVIEMCNNFVQHHKHPMGDKLPLMDPVDGLFTLMLYFCVVAVLFPVSKVLGRQSLQTFAMLHNLFLTVLSLYMCFTLIATAIAAGYSLWNNAVTTNAAGWRMAKILWVFYVSKIPEFNDTIIMILKHNYRQVSFLHIYHHGSILVVMYLFMSRAPGGEVYFLSILNSGIHIAMYGYYLLMSAFPEGAVRQILAKNKFCITYGQMAQFVLDICQGLYLMFVASPLKYPYYLAVILTVYMTSFLILFSNFLVQNQGKPLPPAQKHQRSDKSKAKKA